MSIQTDYSSLSKGARWHLKAGVEGRYYLIGSSQVTWIIIGLIALVSGLSSAFMAIVLSGAEQVIYTVVTFLLWPFIILALGRRHHFVFDRHQGQLLHRKSWWGLFVKELPGPPLSELKVVVAPIAELSEGCQLEVLKQRFTVGSLEQTRQLALFLHRYFKVQAVDRVTEWPEERPLVLPVTEPEAVMAIAVGKDNKGPSVLPVTYRGVWERYIVLKLVWPFPLFVILGVLSMLIGNRGG
ncbi:hypothetical protein [Marinobacterium marinum]|uniref:Uncharacterized protein n=1 Tax=Marinobacterium marinum TaxID=2756129 RepID=A0A7W1WXD7_9GAMM|nr:hypothetical protein [Marinobacterium marinum]MBA4501816.1 hypothetical protein [Marinobacterium marinum]